MGFQLQRIDTFPIGAGLVAAKAATARLEACGVPAVALALPVINVLITVVWLQLSIIGVKADDSMIAVAIFAAFAGLAMLASRFRRTQAVAGVLGTIAVVFGGFAATSFPSALGVALGLPLQDQAFLRFDAMLGFDHAAFYDWLIGVPYAVRVMSVCYGLTILFVLLAAIVLVLLGRYDRLREFNLIFAVSLTVVVYVAALVPSAGLFTEVRFTAEVLMALPEESGTYHLDLFHMLRSGLPVVYGPFDNPGVIVFPSFHTCMALLVAYALHDDPVLKWPTRFYCMCTLIATVPFGSHYVADIAGGAAIFAACVRLARERERGAEPAALSAPAMAPA